MSPRLLLCRSPHSQCVNVCGCVSVCVITICSTLSYSNPSEITSSKENGRLTLSPLAPSSPCKRGQTQHTHAHTCLLIKKKARGRELGTDQGTVDMMAEDNASVRDRGTHPWFSVLPKIKGNSKTGEKNMTLVGRP